MHLGKPRLGAGGGLGGGPVGEQSHIAKVGGRLETEITSVLGRGCLWLLCQS